MKSAYCTTCSTSNLIGAPFCGHCGAVLKARPQSLTLKCKPLRIVALINTAANLGAFLLVYLLASRYYAFMFVGLLTPLASLLHTGFGITMFVLRKKYKHRINKAARIAIALNFWLLVAGFASFAASFMGIVTWRLASICFVISYILPLVIFILALIPSKDTQLKELSHVF